MSYQALTKSIQRHCVPTYRLLCECILLYLFLVAISAAQAAAPDDISINQRAWFDAVDIDADTDYTDNPANNALVPNWSDKSGSGNHLSGVGDGTTLLPP